jgi:D-beta-D-heptose 7-phosphate kinase/D-beta-D-heptose 1-phosphate adenosyltransferase
MKLPTARFVRIVKSMQGRRVAVVGDLMLDRYLWGTASRLSPEAAVPVVDFVEDTCCPGGAGNVAANLAALGAKVAPFGVVGEDEFAPMLRSALRAAGLPEKGIVADSARRTTVKTRLIARHQQIVRVDRETRSALAGPVEEHLIRRVIGSLRSARALVVSDYDKGVVTEELSKRVLGACQRLGLPAFVKPKRSRGPKYPGATAIVLNCVEAGFLVTRALDDDDSVEEAGRKLLEYFACPAVLITRREQGMNLFEQDAPKSFHIAAISREMPFGRSAHAASPHQLEGRQVFDVTGAGDTVLATLALAAAAGASLREAAVLANVAAGVVVGKLGTATLTPAELLSALREIA